MRKALTATRNQTSNFVISFATAVIKSARKYFSAFIIDLGNRSEFETIFETVFSFAITAAISCLHGERETGRRKV